MTYFPNSTIRHEAGDLLARLLDSWFPRCLEDVGFHQTYDRAWNPLKDSGKFVVFQSRMTWAAATCADALPDRKTTLETYARHGLACLKDRFWDTKYGGFHGFLPGTGGDKSLYGMAFGLFASAACARVLQDDEARAFALEAFEWIDRCLHDEVHGGYLEACTRQGVPQAHNGLGAPQWKTLNTQMHMLEALLELFAASGEGKVRERTYEMLEIFLSRLFREPGMLLNRTYLDWSSAADRWEIGHDLEVAYLLLLAEEVLGHEVPRLEEKAAKLVDNALEGGFDAELGGFYDWAMPDGRRFDAKGWWPQMEGLNALVHACKRWNEPAQQDALAKQWAWVRDRQWDAEHGGFYGTLSRTGALIDDGRKGHAWKAAYHDTRALLNVMRFNASASLNERTR